MSADIRKETTVTVAVPCAWCPERTYVELEVSHLQIEGRTAVSMLTPRPVYGSVHDCPGPS